MSEKSDGHPWHLLTRETIFYSCEPTDQLKWPNQSPLLSGGKVSHFAAKTHQWSSRFLWKFLLWWITIKVRIVLNGQKLLRGRRKQEEENWEQGVTQNNIWVPLPRERGAIEPYLSLWRITKVFCVLCVEHRERFWGLFVVFLLVLSLLIFWCNPRPRCESHFQRTERGRLSPGLNPELRELCFGVERHT